MATLLLSQGTRLPLSETVVTVVSGLVTVMLVPLMEIDVGPEYRHPYSPATVASWLLLWGGVSTEWPNELLAVS